MNQSKKFPVLFKKRDLLLLVLILAGAGLLFFLFWPQMVPNKPLAVVSIGMGQEQEIQYIELDTEGLVHIAGGDLPVQLSVEEGGIRFVNSVCADHLCEAYGLLEQEGDWAACLPAKVIVRVESGA